MKIPKVYTKGFSNNTVAENRKIVEEKYKSFVGKKVINKDTQLPIVFVSRGVKKVAYGNNMYAKLFASVNVIYVLLINGKLNNYSKRKPTDPKSILGYMNFDSKCYIDNKLNVVKLSVRLMKGGGHHYSLNIKK
jgi:hypothetical protein